MKNDHTLWKTYFSRPFDANIHPSSVRELIPKEEYLISTSFLGCLDVFYSYGADLIVFGNSETYRALIPDQLALALPLAQRKTLFCVRAGGNDITLLEAARFIERAIRLKGIAKPQKILLGYSFWQAYTLPNGSHDPFIEEKKELAMFALFHLDLRSTFRLLGSIAFDSGIGDLLLFPKWQTIFPWNYFSNIHRFPLGSRGEPRASLPKVKQRSAPQIVQKNTLVASRTVGGFYLNQSDKNTIPTMVQSIEPHFPDLTGQKEAGCRDRTSIEQKFGRLLTALKPLSKKLYVFLPPVTPLMIKASHACLRPLIVELLEHHSDNTTFVRMDDWSEYDLNWEDYLSKTNDDSLYELSINHTNFGGAHKVTDRIRRWLEERDPEILRP